jgi:hypothetical protein
MNSIEHLLNYCPSDLRNYPNKLPDLVWKFLDILKSRHMNKSEINEYFKGDDMSKPSIVDELIEHNLIQIVEYSYDEWQASKTCNRVTKVNIGSSSIENSAAVPQFQSPQENSDSEEVSFSIG